MGFERPTEFSSSISLASPNRQHLNSCLSLYLSNEGSQGQMCLPSLLLGGETSLQPPLFSLTTLFLPLVHASPRHTSLLRSLLGDLVQPSQTSFCLNSASLSKTYRHGNAVRVLLQGYEKHMDRGN